MQAARTRCCIRLAARGLQAAGVPPIRPELVSRLEDACRAGGSTFHSTGLNPGWMGDLLPLTMSAMSRNISSITIREISNFQFYPSPEIMFDSMGFGSTLEVFERDNGNFVGVRTPRFKLIRGPGDQVRLFDLRADPRERRNLATARPGLAAELSSELETWRRTRPRISAEDASTTDLDPATEDRLRALGYVIR